MAVSILTSAFGVDVNVNVNPKTLTINAPSGLSATNMWVINIASDSNTGVVIGVPPGWTAINSIIAGASSGWPSFRAMYKIVSAAETSVDVTLSAAGTWDIVWNTLRITGHSSVNPIGEVKTSTPAGASNTVAAPIVGVSANNSLVVVGCFVEGDGGSGNTVTTPASTNIINIRDGVSKYPTGAMTWVAKNYGTYDPGNWTFTRGDTDDQNAAAITYVILAPVDTTISVDALTGTLSSPVAQIPYDGDFKTITLRF